MARMLARTSIFAKGRSSGRPESGINAGSKKSRLPDGSRRRKDHVSDTQLSEPIHTDQAIVANDGRPPGRRDHQVSAR